MFSFIHNVYEDEEKATEYTPKDEKSFFFKFHFYIFISAFEKKYIFGWLMNLIAFMLGHSYSMS